MMKTYVKAHSLNENYRMDDYGVRVLISSLKAAKAFSDKVYGIVMPYEPEFQAKAEKYADYDDFIKKVAEQSGITIIDLRKDFPLTSADFADAMHMNRSSLDKLLSVIANRIHGPETSESIPTEPYDPSSRLPSAEVH